MKRLSILIVFLCLLLGVGCNNKEGTEEIIEEGNSTPPVNSIMISESRYFEESEFIDEENTDDGYYKQSYKYDGIKFTLERMKHEEHSDFPVYVEDRKIYDLKSNNKNINDEMDMDLSYPARKATYMTNVDNKEIFNEDILVSAEQWDFRIHIETDMKDYDNNSTIIDDIVKCIKIEKVN